MNELCTQQRRGLGMGRRVREAMGRQGRNRLGVGLTMLLAAACFCLQGAAQVPCCKIPQSPRELKSADYNYTSTVPIVVHDTDTSILYTPRAGVAPMKLNRCSQHYHCHIENVQECPTLAEVGASPADESKACSKPKVGDLIEIHTAYHKGPLCTPTPQGLDCCTQEPIVVVGDHATVIAGTTPGGIPVLFGPPAAEWSGSTTNEDNVPNECKPGVFWHFALGCKNTIGLTTLEHALDHPDAARPLQPADRLSHDLTHVVAHK